MTDTVLVTGAFGLIGSATVRRLVAAGRRVIVTGRRSMANRKASNIIPGDVEVRWADLAEQEAAERVVSETSPAAIIHLAGVTPPLIYRDAGVARRVNVDATTALVRAAERIPHRLRFVHASSTAVHGARNPHRFTDMLRAETPTAPFEAYGAQKLDAEMAVRTSNLEWVILRLGGVVDVGPSATSFDFDAFYFDKALPTDGRTHTIDVRDAATAFAAATTSDVAGEILMIGGDESHMLRQGEIGSAIAAAFGIGTVLPVGRPGNPNSDDDWFTIDWMDTSHSQQALSFQHHSWHDMLAEIRDRVGWKRFPARLVASAASPLLNRRLPYRDARPGQYADPWNAIQTRFGDPIVGRT